MIICEVGLNHLGDEKYAEEYVDTAIQSKVDALTFYIGDNSFYQQPKFSNFKLSDEFYLKTTKKLKEKIITIKFSEQNLKNIML